MSLFEFGPYWDGSTFIFFMVIGVLLAFLCRKGALFNHQWALRNKIELKQKFNGYYLLAFLILWFFYAFKGESVGTDTDNYLYAFDRALKTKIDFTQVLSFYQTEPLYILFTKAIRSMTGNHTVFFAVVGLIVSYGYIRFISTYWDEKSEYIFLIPIVVSYFSAMSGIRNALGISFLLLSLCAYKEDKILKAVFLTIIGTFFHYTIVINIPVLMYCYLFRKKEGKVKKSVIFPTIIISVIAVFSLTKLNVFLADTKYSYYSEAGSGTLIGNWYVLLGILAALYVLFAYRPEVKKDYINTLVVMSNIIVLIIVLGSGAYRLTYYYAFPRMYVWGYILPKIHGEKNSAVYSAILKFVSLMFVFIYILFRFSRFSANPGFEYELIFM